MIYPPIEELAKGKYNRYVLVIATAKCANIVTDEYILQRETAEKLLANKETERSVATMLKRDTRDEKAVRAAIRRLYAGEYRIVDSTLTIVPDVNINTSGIAGSTSFAKSEAAKAAKANEDV